MGVESQSCFYEAEYRPASSLWVGGGAVSKYLVAFKSLMGLQPFDVRFFSGEKFTKFNLALEKFIKNCSKLV